MLKPMNNRCYHDRKNFKRIALASLKKALGVAVRQIKVDAASWFDILRNGGFELTIRSHLLHHVQTQFANTLAFSEVHVPQSSRRLDLVLYCRGCEKPVLVLELKGNYLSQTNDIQTEQRKAKATLRAASEDDRFSEAQLFVLHFIVILGAQPPSRTACDHNHFLQGRTGYKRFTCGKAPANAKSLPPVEGLDRKHLLSRTTIRGAGAKDGAFAQLCTWRVPFSRPRKKRK
jgi:hypothetical protein